MVLVSSRANIVNINLRNKQKEALNLVKFKASHSNLQYKSLSHN